MFSPIILLSSPRTGPPSTAYTKTKWYGLYREIAIYPGAHSDILNN
jgi:hypothetical protein